MYDILVTTQRGLEKIATEYIRDLAGDVEIKVKPYGFSGLILLSGASDKYSLAKKIEENVPEVEKVFIVERAVKANIEDIVEAVKGVVKGKIGSDETFAVRTRRRGKHRFTSIDVNVRVGDVVREVTGADVDLDYPDKIVWVDIIQDVALISITSGVVEHKKMRPGKPAIKSFLSKLSLVQVPYLGPLDAVYRIGLRIGRATQTFEIGELVVAPYQACTGEELYHFLKGVFEGISSRYRIQEKTYAYRPRRVKVLVQDLYQLIRERRGEVIIATSTRGEVLYKALDSVIPALKKAKRINILVGAREGLPVGVFRFASIVVDLSPGVTISTDFAGVAAIVALLTSLEERGFFPIFEGKKKSK
ncbi:MAG: RNA-binding protein [Thermoprotei archaeon]|nr:MAG: RNA-binding protein [Thermoprotei archaeon]RLF03022.1 MAG: RNA-binding protein [Thermoprotei archaeon]